MKTKLLLIIIILQLFPLCLSAQIQRWEIGLSYPTPIGSNFIRKNYNGILGLDISYHILNRKVISSGITLDGSWLHASDLELNNLIFKPSVFFKVHIGRFCPYAGVGYALFSYFANGQFRYSDMTNDGLYLNAGGKVLISHGVYFRIAYDFFRLRHEDFSDIAYNRNIQMLNFGFGYNFGFQKD